MAKPVMTPNEGAEQTRKRIRSKIRWLVAQSTHLCWGVATTLETLDTWILTMDDRQNKRAGGLGRKKRA